MSQPVAEPKVAVKINEDYCSRCSICGSLCPYDAITQDHDEHRMVLDIEKCQVCGICYSACPAKAIDDFDIGLSKRKAIYIPYSQAVPLKYVIDSNRCIYFKKGKGKCRNQF